MVEKFYERQQREDYDQTGWPAQANAMPPQVAETITTTRSDINLQICHLNQVSSLTNCRHSYMNCTLYIHIYNKKREEKECKPQV